MKKNFFNFLFCSALFLVLATFISCGGGGGGGGSASLYDPTASGMRNEGVKKGYGGSSSSTTSNSTTATVVLSGGTSLEVEYYEYNGQRYTTAQELTEVLTKEPINGTIEIPLHAKDGTDRIAKYVANGDVRTLKHPYKITIKDTQGNQIFSSTPPEGSTDNPQYFYASEGFPMLNVANPGATENICGIPFTFGSDSWAVTNASGNTVTVANNGTFSGSLMEGAEFLAAPVPAEKYTVDSSGNLGFSSLCTNGEEITIPAGTTSITQICIPADKQIELNLKNANMSTFGSTTINSSSKLSITSIVLPDAIAENDAVTVPLDGAFQDCTNLQSVTLPETLNTIGQHAFANCENLTSINTENIQNINASVFSGCKKLESINLSSAISIGNYAFQGCERLGSVTLNSSATTFNIGQWAFDSCTSLEQIEIPNSCNTIKTGAFNECTSLTQVTGMQGVTQIGEKAFYGCQLLTISEFPPSLTKIFPSAFEGCKFSNTLTRFPTSLEEIEAKAFKNCTTLSISNDFSLPASLRTVGNNAFENCTNCTFSIPATITSIGQYAFAGSGVTGANINGSMSSIAEGAFKNCTSLANVILGSSTTTIDKYAFEGCTNLTSCTGTNSVTTLGEKAFYNCKKLAITGNVPATTVGAYAFYNCSTDLSAAPSFTISNLLSVGEYAFYKSNVGSATFSNSASEIPESAFEDCIQLETATLPSSGSITIGNNAFKGCSSLYMGSTTAFDAVTSIGDSAFEGCSTITTPSSGGDGSLTFNITTYFGACAFKNCGSITNLSIPGNFISFGADAFQNSTGTGTTVYFNSPTYDPTECLTYGNTTVFDQGTELIHTHGSNTDEYVWNTTTGQWEE